MLSHERLELVSSTLLDTEARVTTDLSIFFNKTGVKSDGIRIYLKNCQVTTTKIKSLKLALLKSQKSDFKIEAVLLLVTKLLDLMRRLSNLVCSESQTGWQKSLCGFMQVLYVKNRDFVFREPLTRRSTPSLRHTLFRMALAINFQSKSQVKIIQRIFIKETSGFSVPVTFIGLQCETAAALRLCMCMFVNACVHRDVNELVS